MCEEHATESEAETNLIYCPFPKHYLCIIDKAVCEIDIFDQYGHSNPESFKVIFYIFFIFVLLTNFTEGFRNESCLF